MRVTSPARSSDGAAALAAGFALSATASLVLFRSPALADTNATIGGWLDFLPHNWTVAGFPAIRSIAVVMLGQGTILQLAVMAVSIAGFVAFTSGTPWMILLPALLPVIVSSLFLIAFTYYRRETGWLMFATFVCGAVLASALSTTANELAQLRLAGVVGQDWARVLTPTVAAPILEELCKALLLLVVLLVRRESERPRLDCIVYGAFVGLGFAVVENINYFTLAAVQGGTAGLMRSVYLRAFLGGLNHALFTGMVGAGIGALWAAFGAVRGWLALSAGFVGAVTQHMVWNAWASRAITEVLCGAADPGGPCRTVPAHSDLFGTVPLIAAISVAPGLIAVCVLMRNASRAVDRAPSAPVKHAITGS